MLCAWNDGAGGRVRSPWQRPHPPLAVAAFGPKGLAQAARRGLPYLPSPLEGPRRLAENLERWRAGLPDGSESIEHVVPVMRTVHAAADEREAAQVLAALEAQERSLRQTGGKAPRAIAEATEEDLSERVVVGTVAEVIDRLGALREKLGIDLLIARAQLPPGGDPSSAQDSLQRLAEEVWPAVR
jgi:alkanesulfonate monooxygenase SsuD/methylene tetrahydromethanopterin reductase-like flavin-dependent oxidoreductase (luciferase family)